MANCSLALVLAMDISLSVTAQNFELQRNATADAILNDRVLASIGPEAPIAITAVYWGTSSAQVVDWVLIRSERDAVSFATRLRGVTRQSIVDSGDTRISQAIRYSSRLFVTAPCTPDRMLIDISGDGKEFHGTPSEARDEAAEAGITINGLTIINMEPDVTDFYRDNVVTPDGFLIEAQSWEHFTRAIRNKLTIEIAGYFLQ